MDEFRSRRLALAATTGVLLLALGLFLLDAGTTAPSAAGFQPGGVPTQTPVPTPSPTPAPGVPTIVEVEVRPDRSVALEWTQSMGASSYDIGVRTAADGGSPAGAWTVVATRTAPVNAETVRRVVKAVEDWPAVDGDAYEFAVRGNAGDTGWSITAPVTVGLSQPALTAGGFAPNVVNIEWTSVDFDEPFVAYEVLLGDATDRIPECLSQTVTDRSIGIINTTATADDCGAEPLVGATDYTAGVRVVRNTSPRVVDEIVVATAATGGGNALADEKFSTAQVNGIWEIVDENNQPVIWESINMRRGELTSYLFSVSEYESMLAEGFDSVRIVLEWDKFQRQPDAFDQSAFAALDRAVDWAETAGIDIIIDPLHLAEGPDWNIPSWAWDTTNDGTRDDLVVLDAVRENSTDFLRYVTQRYRSRDHVIAIDIINEPREPAGGALDARNSILMDLYHDLIKTVRDLETDKPLIIQPYYGSSKTTTERILEVDDPTIVDPTPDPADYTNLIWSVHDYYAGREGTATDDGYTNGGYPLRGTASDGTRHRTESFSGTGCYPSGPDANTCTNDTSRGSVLRPSMLVHLKYHYDEAQAAGMPLYVGEYGLPHDGFGFDGWSGAEELLTDKVWAFDQLGVSRALWIWRVDVDPTFGMYSRTTRSWHPWTPYATGAASIPLDGNDNGDVNCDGGRDIVDALLIAQFSVGNRTDNSCPLPDPLTQIDSAGGDMNNDGNTDIVDALLVAQCVAGIALPEC